MPVNGCNRGAGEVGLSGKGLRKRGGGGGDDSSSSIAARASGLQWRGEGRAPEVDLVNSAIEADEEVVASGEEGEGFFFFIERKIFSKSAYDDEALQLHRPQNGVVKRILSPHHWFVRVCNIVPRLLEVRAAAERWGKIIFLGAVECFKYWQLRAKLKLTTDYGDSCTAVCIRSPP
ncbi:hypothetical protein V9T40_004439 [Parthenolecanium corni]|uniref:Uncharacterized protein n=1 Tax=Parthenolecanium corni TaxID=536013 RepID=A0AAN9TU03_9HEMI